MASSNTFSGVGVGSMELSVADAIYALSDIIEAYQSPSHLALLETFRKEHGGNMIKRMQIVYPAAIKLQAQVTSFNAGLVMNYKFILTILRMGGVRYPT